MSQKKAKKAVKKIVVAEVRLVPYAFDDDIFVETRQKGFSSWPFLRFNFHEHSTPSSENEFVDVGSFQMLLLKFRRKSFLLLLLRPLLLPLILSFLHLSILKRKHLPNSRRSLSLPFTGVKIPSKMLPCLKFVKISLKAKLPLLPWLPLTRASVRPTVVNY
jgi:hypothetical protein